MTLTYSRSGGEAATRGRYLGDPERPVGRVVNTGTPRRGRKVVVGVNVSVNVVADGADIDLIGPDGYLDRAYGPYYLSAHRGYGRAYPLTRPGYAHAGVWNGGAIRTRVARARARVGIGVVLGSVCLSRPSYFVRLDRPRPIGAAERL